MKNPQAVYFHIPFCERLCPYCDFNKFVRNGQPVMEYLQALRKEMEYTVQEIPPGEIHSIFVGGGTPTALSAGEMEFFLQSVHEFFQPQIEDLEFTMEANPESLDEEKLKVMKEGKVNRLSIGVQAFQEELLKRLGRLHSAEDVFHAVETAKKQGFVNISLDLMFGLPNQTLKMFEESLDIAFSFDVSHFSAYGLKVEEGTFFHRLYEKARLPLPPEEEEYQMYMKLIEKMEEKGYSQYEISNFARPGFASRHNITYWKNESYYGLGAGAHGYIKGQRCVNAGPLDDYMRLVSETGRPVVELNPISKKEQMEDFMILGLRMIEGVSGKEFHQRYGVSLYEIFGDAIRGLLEKGLLVQEGDALRLTKMGIPLGNEVFICFLS